MDTIFSQLRADEIEVSFVNIMRQCIKHIKLVIVVIVALAILLPSLVFVLDYKDYQNANNKFDISDVEEQLTTLEKNTIEKCMALKEKQSFLDEYKEKSELLKINCNDVYTTTLQFYISSKDGAIESIVDAYKSYVQNGGLAVKICELDNSFDSSVISELFSIKKDEVDYDVLVINVVAGANEKNKEISSMIKKAVLEYKGQIEEKVGAHTAECIQEITTHGYNDEVFEAQKKFYETYEQGARDINTIELTFSDAQKMVMYGEGSEEDTSEVAVPKFKVLFAVVGAVIGCIIAVGCVAVLVVLNGKVQSESELNKRFGYRCINAIYMKPNSFMNRLMKNNASEISTQLTQTGEKIKSRLEDFNAKKVAILVDCSKSGEEVCQKLVKELSFQGITAKLIYDIKNNVEEYQDVKVYKNVLFVSEVANREVKKTYDEVSICNELDLSIIGYISLSE